MEKDRFFEALKQIPKAEIHLHLEDFLAGEAATEEKLEDLSKFCEVFRSVQDSLRSVEDLEVAFRNLVNYMNQNGIAYAEVFFSPGRFLRGGWQYAEMVKFIESQLKNAKSKYSLIIKLIVDVSRSHGVDKANAVLTDIINNPSKDIIGIGLGGDEKIGPARDYVDLFVKARKSGLRTVAHAGESAEPQSIIDAIKLLKAERIGHGTSAIMDKATMDMLVKKQIPVEIQPTSNVVTGHFVKDMKKHPIKTFLEQGAFVTLNTDDPNLFNTSLIEEYWKLYSEVKLNYDDLYQIIVNGFKASFLVEEKKKDYITKVNKKWNRQLKLNERQYAPWQTNLKAVFEGRDY